MKTEEWHQQGFFGEFIVKFKKKHLFYYFTFE